MGNLNWKVIAAGVVSLAIMVLGYFGVPQSAFCPAPAAPIAVPVQQ